MLRLLRRGKLNAITNTRTMAIGVGKRGKTTVSQFTLHKVNIKEWVNSGETVLGIPSPGNGRKEPGGSSQSEGWMNNKCFGKHYQTETHSKPDNYLQIYLWVVIKSQWFPLPETYLNLSVGNQFNLVQYLPSRGASFASFSPDCQAET